MLGVLKSFEETATRLSPIILVVPGLMAVGVGLFVWLGASGFKRIGLAVVGATCGVIAAIGLLNQSVGAMIALALIGAFVGAVLQRFFTAALAGALGVTAAFLIVAWPLLGQDQGVSLGAEPTDAAETLSTRDSAEVVRITVVDLRDSIKLAGRQLTPALWGIVMIAGAVSLGGALVMRHLGKALSCSILGAALIFAGLVLLLLNKGSEPITRIGLRPGYYILAFLSVVAFGTIEQWLLCRRLGARARGKNSKRSKGRQADEAPSRGSWRGR